MIGKLRTMRNRKSPLYEVEPERYCNSLSIQNERWYNIGTNSLSISKSSTCTSILLTEAKLLSIIQNQHTFAVCANDNVLLAP